MVAQNHIHNPLLDDRLQRDLSILYPVLVVLHDSDENTYLQQLKVHRRLGSLLAEAAKSTVDTILHSFTVSFIFL